MRFASLGASNANNYAAAGKTVADSAAKTFAVQRKTGPDYAGLSKVAMKTNSNEKVAAIKAEAEVTKAGIKAVEGVTNDKTKADLTKFRSDLKTKGKMAGGIAALGAMAGAGFLLKDNEEGRERPTADRQSIIDEFKAGRDRIDAGYDADIKALDEPGSSNNSSPTVTDGGTDAPKASNASVGSGASDDGDISMRYMQTLTNNGMSDVQAAALVGHLKVESDNFQADTEYSPNAYGTKGRGHLQWTDTGNSGGRRSNFESYANANKLSPTSFEANSGFLLSELAGNHGNHWTGGGSLEAFKGISDFDTASSYLQNNYIRPGVPHTDRRLQGGRDVLSQWRSRQS